MARPRQITDEQILATTRAAVLDQGAQVALDAIAAKLGVTAPALLKRFGSREELMLRSLTPTRLPATSLRPVAPNVSLELQLEALFTTVFEFFEEAIPCVAALRESGIPHKRVFGQFAKQGASPADLLDALIGWVDSAVALRLASTSASEAVATAILGALQTRIFTAHVMKRSYSSRSNHQYLKDLAQLFSKALSVDTPSRRRPKG